MKEHLEKENAVNNSWNQFLTSGRVEDYLSYVSDCRENMTAKVEADWVGESPHAGVYTGNRNHIETDAYR